MIVNRIKGALVYSFTWTLVFANPPAKPDFDMSNMGTHKLVVLHI